MAQPHDKRSAKNWPLAKWKALAEILKDLGHKVRVLGEPSEKDWISKKFAGSLIGAWSFSEVRDQSELCRLLITGDTSVPHLLALEQVPMVGLFLGPANFNKTAPRLSGISCLGTKLACAPCEHRGGCSQPTQICAESISVKDVLQVIQYHFKELQLNQVELSGETSWLGPTGEHYEKDSNQRERPNRGSPSTMADSA